VHVTELRSALDGARSTLHLSSLSYAHALSAGVSIRAIDVTELRNGVK
jgi:hypothetical protein